MCGWLSVIPRPGQQFRRRGSLRRVAFEFLGAADRGPLALAAFGAWGCHSGFEVVAA